MTLAPVPGIGAREDRADAAATVLTITIRGESHHLAPNNLTFDEKQVVRKATGGVAFESYWAGAASIGIDSVQVLWWLARRAGGERTLTLTQVLDQWPENLNIETELDVSLETEDDSPEV